MADQRREMLPVERDFEPINREQQLEAAIAEAEIRLELLNRVTTIALKRTQEQDWVDFDGKPYLTAAGAERLRPLFGIALAGAEPKRYEDRDERGSYYWFVVTGQATFRADTMAVMGTCSSRDQFFSTRYQYVDGKRERVLLPASEVDPTNIVKAAYSNMVVNAVTRILGIRNLTWAQLQDAGLDPSKVAKVEFRKKPAAPPAAPAARPAATAPPTAPAAGGAAGKAPSGPPKGPTWLVSLRALMREFLGGRDPDGPLGVEVLTRITAFTPKSGAPFAGYRSWAGLERGRTPERAAEVAYRRLEELLKVQGPMPRETVADPAAVQASTPAVPPSGDPGPEEPGQQGVA